MAINEAYVKYKERLTELLTPPIEQMGRAIMRLRGILHEEFAKYKRAEVGMAWTAVFNEFTDSLTQAQTIEVQASKPDDEQPTTVFVFDKSLSREDKNLILMKVAKEIKRTVSEKYGVSFNAEDILD